MDQGVGPAGFRRVVGDGEITLRWTRSDDVTDPSCSTADEGLPSWEDDTAPTEARSICAPPRAEVGPDVGQTERPLTE